jgi:long-chain acyl-CoA synthetase
MTNSPTIFEVFATVAKHRSRSVALGYKSEEKFKTISYKKLAEQVNRLVTGLKKLGVTEGTKVAVLSSNQPEVVRMDLALNKMGAIVVPIHLSLSPSLIEYIIKDSGAEYLAIGAGFEKYQEIKANVNLRQVITFKNLDWHEGLVNFWDLLKEEPDTQEPVHFDFCNLIYTSGTTGNPKGVMLSNDNFLKNISASQKYVFFNSKDVALSFLPLSHVLERTAGFYNLLYSGGSIFFAESPKTLIDDIKKVRPTVLVAVPRIFEKVYDKVMDNMRAEKPWKRKLFFWSLNISRSYLNSINDKDSPFRPFLCIAHFFADHFVLTKVRKIFGGRLRFVISGGAALDTSIAKFFEAIGLKILEGYGLTETSPIIAVNPAHEYRFGTVGKVIFGVDVKIALDKEILVRGHNVMLGYYNNPEATQEAFTADGWFKTGDLGYLSSDGYLTIIGRKKEMIVTSTGKNVNPVNIESALQINKYISQAMVFGDNHKFIRAFVVPDFEQIKIYAESKGLDLEIFQLVKRPEIIELLKEEINKQLKDFPSNEQVVDFVLLDREFSEDREELTPTLKLKRNKILEHFKELL